MIDRGYRGCSDVYVKATEGAVSTGRVSEDAVSSTGRATEDEVSTGRATDNTVSCA